ncbi:MAG: hypothetical protein M1142_03380 [Patescibacteria group bacterium]|nr:hypothetical protein [Patescibacteria group bacterium]
MEKTDKIILGLRGNEIFAYTLFVVVFGGLPIIGGLMFLQLPQVQLLGLILLIVGLVLTGYFVFLVILQSKKSVSIDKKILTLMTPNWNGSWIKKTVDLSKTKSIGFVKTTSLLYMKNAIMPVGIQHLAFIYEDQSINQLPINQFKTTDVKKILNLIHQNSPSIGFAPEITTYLNS